MKHLSALLLLAFVCTASAQTVKTLGYNTTNGHVVYSGTNTLTFTNGFNIMATIDGLGPALDFVTTDEGLAAGYGDSDFAIGVDAVGFAVKYAASSNSWGYPVLVDQDQTNLVRPNASNMRTALGLGSTAQTIFKVMTNDLSITNQTNATTITNLTFDTAANARYVVTLYPIISGDTQVQIVASNSTVFGQWNGPGTGFASTTELTNERTISSGSDTRGMLQSFYVLGGTNAGSVSLTFFSAVATNTNTIKAGSFMRADLMPE